MQKGCDEVGVVELNWELNEDVLIFEAGFLEAGRM
jgi:hypothetical protein